MKRAFRPIVLGSLVAALAGCAVTDPLLNDRGWTPSGVNELNIAAQVADPADLTLARPAASGSDGNLAAAAVARLRAGKVKPLPDSAITDMQIQSAPGSSSSSAGQ